METQAVRVKEAPAELIKVLYLKGGIKWSCFAFIEVNFFLLLRVGQGLSTCAVPDGKAIWSGTLVWTWLWGLGEQS